MKKLLLALFLPVSVFATNFTVKAGGGGNFTTINACTTQMSASGGDTCTVFAGTYTENPSINAGAVSSYNVLTVNGSDIVTVNGQITVNSHTKIIGNCAALQGTQTSATCGFFIQNASSPTTNCITVAASATDWFVQGNNGYACRGFSSPSTSSLGYILNNTFSYACSTSASPNVCTPLGVFGSKIIVENNDLSHFSDGADGGGDHIVFRGNSFHDAHTGEVSTNGDNHLDVIEMSGNGATLFLFESNTVQNFIVDGGSGAAAHGGPLAQCGTGTCGPLVWRFHRDYHVQGAATTADQGNWPNLKEYNNTWVDMQNGTTGGFTTNNQTNEQSGANVNEIYYYTINPTGGNAGSAYHYSATPGSSSFANNLAWCPNQSSSLCNAGVFSHNSGSFTADTGNVVCDPSFVNSTSDWHLQAGSCALNGGTNLTTTNGAGTSSTTLIVNDANYFQDGWGLPAGAGLGQMTPDCISVTTVGNHVCITAGGINYATNTITLASAISWSSGDKVWLYSDSLGTVRLTGSAPNIGAFGTELATPLPPAPATGLFAQIK